MTWKTPDIEATVAELQARGVVFEEYDTPEVKTFKGVATLGGEKGGLVQGQRRQHAGLGAVRLVSGDVQAHLPQTRSGHLLRWSSEASRCSELVT